MKRKLGVMTATLVMASAMAASIGLSGCGVKIHEFDMPEGGYDGSKVEIMFYNTMGQNLRGVLDGAIERFSVLYPNITVKYDASSGDYNTLRDKLSTEIQTGVQPNLAFCYPDHVALYNDSTVVLPLDGFLPDGEYKDMKVTNSKGEEPLGLTKEQVDDYIPAYFKEGSVFGDGKTYTLPFAKSTEVMYYNKTFFKDNADKFGWDFSGMTDEEISVELDNKLDGRTWDEIFEICAKIKSFKDCTPLGIDSESNLFITLCEQSGTPYTSATGDHYLFNTAENKAFVQKFVDWYQPPAGYFTTETINKAYTSNLFKEQKTYLSIGSSAGAQYQVPKVTDGQAPFEVGIVSIPQVNPEAPKSISQGPSICIFKQENPQEVLASWLFAKFITTDLQFQATYSMTSGYVPVIQSVFENSVYMNHLAKANGAEDGITALSAKVCKKLVDEEAFYVSPAFLGSSKARDEVGILMVAAITKAKTLDKAFSDAIYECKYFVG